jgi:hypothetical protein
LTRARPLKLVPNLDYVTKPGDQREPCLPSTQAPGRVKMSFETVSLLLNWMEMGALLAILCRLSSTFELIASTQRELRRAIHHLGERRTAELSINNAFGGPGIARASAESKLDPTVWPAYRLGK